MASSAVPRGNACRRLAAISGYGFYRGWWISAALVALAGAGCLANAVEYWVYAIRRKRARRFEAGYCPKCDYRLIGVTGDRCPECGYWLGVPRGSRR